MSREAAYDVLARLMRLRRDEAHIGLMTAEQCEELVDKLEDLGDLAFRLGPDERIRRRRT